jgi:hypothetical protein
MRRQHISNCICDNHRKLLMLTQHSAQGTNFQAQVQRLLDIRSANTSVQGIDRY